MAIADIRAATVDLPCIAGDDIPMVLTFDVSLAGYTGWLAKVGTVEITVDDALQASNIIKLVIPGSETSEEVEWSLFARDPLSRKLTFMRGTVYPEEVPTSGD